MAAAPSIPVIPAAIKTGPALDSARSSPVRAISTPIQARLRRRPALLETRAQRMLPAPAPRTPRASATPIETAERPRRSSWSGTRIAAKPKPNARSSRAARRSLKSPLKRSRPRAGSRRRHRRRRPPGSERRLGRPGKIDPAVGSPPDVLAPDDRPRLLVEHGAADVQDLLGAEILDQLEGRAGIGDVVRDQDTRALQVDRVEQGRQHHGKVEALLDPGVELDVHGEQVLH